MATMIGAESSAMETPDVEMRHASTDAVMEQQQVPNSGMTSRIRLSASLQNEKDAMEEDAAPQFKPLSVGQQGAGKKNLAEYRRVRCPPHRYTPLREHWEQILTPLVEYLKLQVRFGTTHAEEIWDCCVFESSTEDETLLNSESSVLFLEIQTLREAAILCDAICDLWSQSDVLELHQTIPIAFVDLLAIVPKCC
jgi:hypothetical protein